MVESNLMRERDGVPMPIKARKRIIVSIKVVAFCDIKKYL